MRNAVLIACALVAGLPAASQAQLPAPLDAVRFGFPGAFAGPATAVSAALALSDRWLGDAPFDNPALRPDALLALTPALQRMSRQDLRADNRDFDEQAVFFDAAGAWIGAEALGVMWSGYASQPMVRLENHAYVRGLFATPEPPAVIESQTTARELRAGLGASIGAGGARVGVAAEWTRRDDQYDQVERSGSPGAGTRQATLSGDAIGFAAGVRLEGGGGGAWGGGAALRFLPELAVDGEATAALVSGDSRTTFEATRESGWEGGASGRVVVTPTFTLTAGAGGRTAQAWEGFGVEAGPWFAWSAGGAFHDPETRWSARFGVGQEQQRGVPEPRAGVVGLGFGWGDESWTLDLGLVRRSFERPGLPTSFDDRVLATYTLAF